VYAPGDVRLLVLRPGASHQGLQQLKALQELLAQLQQVREEGTMCWQPRPRPLQQCFADAMGGKGGGNLKQHARTHHLLASQCDGVLTEHMSSGTHNPLAF
jgi:hypothetical protein